MRKFILALLLVSFGLSVTVAQSNVTAVVVNEFANIRIIPAIGAEVRGTVAAGYLFDRIDARSPDNEWLRVDFNGDEGWVNVAPLTILSGDINTLPVADPRTIPYGGFESPRAGLTSASSNISARLTSGLRVRAGPSTGYPVLANAPRNSVVPLLGRTASSAWVQVNFEGTLGWVATRFLELLDGATLASLTIDGIVAEQLPISEPVEEDYLATLRLLLDRVNLAQPSLDSIRASWADAALTGRATCRPYPARPSDYNIPNELLAAFYPTLDPIITLFNDTMANIRRSIDLFIEVCNQPGTVNPVGQARVIGALEIVAVADSQIAELRRRITELIPPDQEIGENECLFTFLGGADILSVIQPSVLVRDDLNPEKRATGYCIDLAAGQNIVIEIVQIGDSNITPVLSLSPFDNPTNFIATGTGGFDLAVGPLLIPANGRYLLVVSNQGATEQPLNGEYALLVTIIPPGTANTDFLFLDPTTGEPIASSPGALPGQPAPVPGQPTLAPGQPIATVELPPGQVIVTVTPAVGQSVPNSSVVCPGVGLTCEELASCEEAYACLDAGNFSLDPDEDGVPCEVTRCPSN